MNDYLDEMGARARDETRVTPPSRAWFKARRARRRLRRQAAAGLAALTIGLVAGGAWAVLDTPSSSQRTEAVAPATDDEPTVTFETSTPRPTQTTLAPTTTTSIPVGCGPWPEGLMFWPDQESQPPVDTVDDDGQAMRRQTSGDYTLEVWWPPTPRPDYDLDYAGPIDSSFWAHDDGETTHIGFTTADEESGSVDATPADLPGPEYLRLSDHDPEIAGLEGDCTIFEFRVYDGDTLVDRVALDFDSVGDRPEGAPRTRTSDQSFEWVDIGPIVTEQRSVGAVPESGRCDGVLLDIGTTTFRIDEAPAQGETLGRAISSGAFVVVADPMAESKVVEPGELWAVLMPHYSLDATIGDLTDAAQLHVIDASTYEDFVDPEIGPTLGPGVSGEFDQPIEALKAFFDHPAAMTFIKSNLVELHVDESTIAYGVPWGHGRDDWITVITVELQPDGWLVTGWTSAGC